MTINNDAYGGFVVSKNVVSGRPIRYSFRDKSDVKHDLCWMYEEGVHTGFYDLKNNKDISIREILK